MKLLILLIAMGVIGVIGTVELSHAQTILTITPPTPETTGGAVFDYATDTSTTKWYSQASNETLNNQLEGDEDIVIGTVHTQPDTFFKPNPALPDTTNLDMSCNTGLISVKNMLKWYPTNIPNLTKPSNIPDNNDTITAIGFEFKINTYEECTVNLLTTSSNPVFTTKELQYTLYNQSDKKAYYFSPRENIMEAQPIPLCTNENFNTNDQTLKGDNNMCYGKHGDNMVIVTKRITGFYGATTTITTPANPVELNPAPAKTEPDNTPDNTPTQPDNTPDNNNNDEISEQEKAYRELLKKLYLPAI